MKIMSNGKQFTKGGYTNSETATMIKNGENNMRAFLAEKFPEIYGTPAVETKTSNITKIRRAVATLANKINRKIKNLSAAFKKAWAVIKGKTIQSKVSGVTFGNTQKALTRLARYNASDISVNLIRESSNEHDINAVGVHVTVRV